MARFYVGALACLAIFTGSEAAHAFGGRWWSSWYGSPAVVYYYPAVRLYPVTWLCPSPGPTVIPLMPEQRMPYASPTPAPPSSSAQTKEPPLASGAAKGPIIVESRSQSGAKGETPAADKCKVGFWNLTGRDISLKIDGQARPLPRDRAITLELGRSFVWQVDQREPSSERVAPEETFHEVVIR